MRIRALTLALAVLLLPSLVWAQATPPQADDIEVNKILQEVQKALVRVQNDTVAMGMPPLDSVTLTLKGSVVLEGGPKFKLWIFSFGRRARNQRAQSVVLTLKPPKAGTPTPVAAASLSDQLVAAIKSAVSGVQQARVTEPPLDLASLSAEFSFLIKRDTSAGGEFKIEPITIGGDVSNSQEEAHTIALVFK